MLITDEMVDFFKKRTNAHIGRVQKFAQRLSEFDGLEKLNDVVLTHDASKFLSPEYEMYVQMQWHKKLGKKPSGKLAREIRVATERHVLKNAHHPEYWDLIDSNIINMNDRNTTLRVIDGTKMPKIYLAEMVCDWSAMAEEFGENGPYRWANENIGKRWKFTDEQITSIYKYIDFLWKD